MTTIEISSITGLSNPYLIEVCDVYGSNCVLLSQIFTTVPPSNTVYLPPQFDSAPSVMVKVNTLDGCVKTEIIDCVTLYTLTPTPTPSITPTLTPTPTLTITPTITPTPTICVPQTIYNGEKFSNLPISNGASFKSDGTIFYTTLHNNTPTDGVCAYSLSTAWDVSTINTPPIACSAETPFVSSANYGSYFSPDGTKLFLANATAVCVIGYTLSTAWDISTASYSQSGTTSVAPLYVEFSPDGYYMFISNNSAIKRYTLSTPWVINTGIVETQSISASSTFAIRFQNNGYYLFSTQTATGQLKITKRTLSIPYDLTSIVSTENSGNLFSVIPSTNFYSLNFKNGYKGFIGNYAIPNSQIYAFEFTCEYNVNGTVILPTPTPTPTKTPTPTPFVWGAISNILYSGTTSGDTCLFVPTDPLSYTGPVYLQIGSGTCCVTSFSDDITSIGRHWYISVSPFVDFPNGWYKLNCPAFPLYDNRLVQITSGLVTQQLYC